MSKHKLVPLPKKKKKKKKPKTETLHNAIAQANSQNISLTKYTN